MNDHDTNRTATPVDELWLGDWAAEGLAALERYLAKQAAFTAFLTARRLLDSGNGNRANAV